VHYHYYLEVLPICDYCCCTDGPLYCCFLAQGFPRGHDKQIEIMMDRRRTSSSDQPLLLQSGVGEDDHGHYHLHIPVTTPTASITTPRNVRETTLEKGEHVVLLSVVGLTHFTVYMFVSCLGPFFVSSSSSSSSSGGGGGGSSSSSSSSSTSICCYCSCRRRSRKKRRRGMRRRRRRRRKK